MTSKKPAQQKRANPPRNADKTRQFKKDWQRLSHSGRYDMHRLKEAMLLLVANDGSLPPEYFDHGLSGDWEGFRDCHVGGDFLLIYNLRETEQDVRETIEADQDIDRNGAIPHGKVMARARAMIERHAAKRRPKAALVGAGSSGRV